MSLYSGSLLILSVFLNCKCVQNQLKEEAKTGECVIDGADDVLSKVLGPEHGGRVRGVGGFVTPSVYFNLPRRKRPSMQETIQKMVKEAVENERAFWIQKLASIEARLLVGIENATAVPVQEPNMNKSKSPVSVQGSCSHNTEKPNEVVVLDVQAKSVDTGDEQNRRPKRKLTLPNEEKEGSELPDQGGTAGDQQMDEEKEQKKKKRGRPSKRLPLQAEEKKESELPDQAVEQQMDEEPNHLLICTLLL